MEPVSRESDRGEGVHHHVHQWLIIVAIVSGVTLLAILVVLQQRGITGSNSLQEGGSAESNWSYEEKIDMLADLNARAEVERSGQVTQ